MDKKPDRLYRDVTDKKLYTQLTEEVFLNQQNKDQFLLVMAFGFHSGKRRQIQERDSGGFVRVEYLTPEDEALIDAIAVFEEGIDILNNESKVYEIAEEYAHAGIHLLYNEIESQKYGSFYKWFELELKDILDNIEQIE